MPMKVYMNVNDYKILEPNEDDQYPHYTLVLKVGNGADVFAKFHPKEFQKFAESIDKHRKRKEGPE